MYSAEFLSYYLKAIDFYETRGGEDNKQNEKKIIHIQKIIESLRTTRFQDYVMVQCARIFYDAYPDFISLINTKNICAFTNGVYDFDAMQFRAGRSTDYLTFTTNKEYIPYNPEDPNVQVIMNFINDILPDRDTAEYLLKIFSSCLTLDISQQKFYVMTGIGGNGKSLLMNIFEICLGDYFGLASSALITKPRENANSANEALASLRTKRAVVFNEVGEKEVIQADIMKMLTGGDSISTRENYGKQIKFKPFFKTITICNNIPALSENGHSEWRRIRIIHFPMKYVDHPNPNNPREKKIDYDLENKLKEAAPAMLSILIEYYKQYKENGLIEPDTVVEHTKKYQEENDRIKLFVKQFLIEDPQGLVESVPLYGIFRRWFKDEYGEKEPAKKAFQEFCNNEMQSNGDDSEDGNYEETAIAFL
ncbi:hypothetical protein BDK51DRAFT_31515 [Blyttiomyces helicus]|uniref:SF3 helicase domain-containing protein n=1 Tax=Blyttiomyces helicus TaxID=388810 RepID=A0A4P9WIR1_9FUNG|nr:hypothetical protein BDK51DRAFT_31515 [Blyttiomyces helicus]|eukprot:RKO90456.1 hypothetical protein BDK51DRAFT_31515 [Blyttiomyces helicus]